MNIEYIGRNFQVDERVRKYVLDKLQKVTKFLEEPIEARLILDVEKHRHIAELHVSHRLGVLQATEETDGQLMTDAIHRVIETIAEQARRSRKKLVDKRRRGDKNGQRWPIEVLDRESVTAGATPRIVQSTHLQIKPMTIEEAALQLEDSEQGFVVFRDSTSDRVSVLYKRKDDNYGLIAPEL